MGCIAHVTAVVCSETTSGTVRNLMQGTFEEDVVVHCLPDHFTKNGECFYITQCQGNGNWSVLQDCIRKFPITLRV